MMSAMGPGFGVTSISVSLKAGVPAVDASLNEGKSQGLDRALQRQKALSGVKNSAPPLSNISQMNQAMGPAQAAARDAALWLGIYSEQALVSQYLVLASGHAPGPKPASVLTAENNYRATRSIANRPVIQTSLA
ncbi:hypothetical protein [Pseudophaeobacter sp.]|uniref:hypothetical protein n=1 Tax=Pseudophaeobacter sp. TaxID=1971739 RepID=UPI003297A394